MIRHPITDACTYPINYYRQALQAANTDQRLPNNTVPTLQLWGLADLYLGPVVGRGSRKYNDDFEEKVFNIKTFSIVSKYVSEVVIIFGLGWCIL